MTTPPAACASPPPAAALVHIRQGFQDRGWRWTLAREQVCRLFLGSPRGHTIAGAVRALRRLGIGQATVYRTVALMEKIHFLRCVHPDDGEHRYVPWHPGHVHALVCRHCGQAFEFGDCGLQLLEELLSARTGFTIEGHHLEIYGLCAGCGAAGVPPAAAPAGGVTRPDNGQAGKGHR